MQGFLSSSSIKGYFIAILSPALALVKQTCQLQALPPGLTGLFHSSFKYEPSNSTISPARSGSKRLQQQAMPRYIPPLLVGGLLPP
ncbi:MAG: hypothetical protein LIO70_08285, partial [Clostridiales bacterium]|nr:hypothetical protein [Clostridiales bacterium]